MVLSSSSTSEGQPAAAVVLVRPRENDDDEELDAIGGSGHQGATVLPAAKKQRKKLPLPTPLRSLTKDNLKDFTVVEEVNTKAKKEEERGPWKVVSKVKVKSDSGGEVEYDLNSSEKDKKLTADHWRELCRNVGCKNWGSLTVFSCRRAIAYKIESDAIYERADAVYSANKMDRMSNTNMRITNIVLGTEDMVDRFLKVNDNKNRSDHEHGTTKKKFYADVALANNNIDDDDDNAIQSIIEMNEDPHYEEYKDVDLTQFDPQTDTSVTSKIKNLMRVRRKMKDNMGQSGTHESDPWEFVQAALGEAKGVGFLDAYYFYQRLEKHPGIDASFQPFLDNSLKGESCQDMSNQNEKLRTSTNKSGGKAETVNVLKQSVDVIREISVDLKERNNKKDNLDQIRIYNDILSNPNAGDSVKQMANQKLEGLLQKL